MTDTKVIAISGASGSGKTSVVKKLAAQFNCHYLLFDDHTDHHTYPQDMRHWFVSGADVSDIKTPEFVIALQQKVKNASHRFLFIEEPFGRARPEMRALIDSVILLDQPLELCLSRLLKRRIDNLGSYTVNDMSGYLQRYDEYFRDIYLEKVNQVRGNCDLVVKGSPSLKDTTKQITRWLKTQ